jgi:hypothetical protein
MEKKNEKPEQFENPPKKKTVVTAFFFVHSICILFVDRLSLLPVECWVTAHSIAFTIQIEIKNTHKFCLPCSSSDAHLV